MAKVCPHCGETSDADKVCTWCNKSLVAEKKPEASGPAASGGAASPPGRETPSTAGGAASGAPVAPPRASERRKLPTVQQPRSLWPYYVGAGVTLVLVIVIASFVAAKTASGPPPDPADWQTKDSMTKLLTVEVPANYKFSTAGSSGSYEQIMIRGTKLCTIDIHGTQTKGALGDTAAASARMAGTEGGPDLAGRGEGKFHVTLESQASMKRPGYTEVGEMAEWTFAGMPAAYSEYAYVKKAGLFAVKMKGWRISCFGGDLGYQIFAEAPEAQWEKFKPTAQRVVESARMGGRQ